MKVIHGLFIFFLSAFSFFVQAQPPLITSEYAYRHYTTSDGLPQMMLTSVFQDSKGFIWVGSKAGMSRYDGFEFSNYMLPNTVGIFTFFENSKGEVTGMDYYKRFKVNNTSNNVTTTAISQKWEYEKGISRGLTGNHKIFAYYPSDDKSETALFELQDDTLKKVFQHDSLSARLNFSNSVYWDKQAHRFFLPNFSGVSVVSEKGKLEAYWKGVFIFDFAQTKNGFFAVGKNGIYQITGTAYQLIYPHDFSQDKIVQLRSHNNDLIIKGDFSLWRFSKNTLEEVFNVNKILTALFIDKEKNIWLATTYGLYNLFQLQFKNYAFRNDEDNIRTVLLDKAGTLWLGTQKGNIYTMDKNEAVKPYVFPPKSSYYSRSQFFHANGAYNPATNSLFFPSGNGVLRITDSKPHWMTIPEDNYNNVKVISGNMCLLCQGYNFYISSEKGESDINIGKDKHLQNEVNDFEEDGEGNIWVFGNEGVTILGKNFKKTLTDSIFQKAYISTKDADGKIWFAAASRLFKATKDSAELVYDFKSPILCMLVYDRSKIVIGSLAGFFVFDYQLKTHHYYDYQNGFTGLQTTTTPILKDADGKIWINSLQYLTVFDINQAAQTAVKPNLQFVSLETSKDNVNWVKTDLSVGRFPHNVGSFKFKYIGLLYSSASNVRYQYRLRGFQDEWSQPVADREVTFNNLPPGKYTFELKCNAGTPETQTETVRLPLEIVPAFWQTWLFKILVLALFLGITVFVISAYLRRKHAREIRKANREKEMNELRVQSVRLKSIPHFNSNVLAGIEYFIMTKSKEDANELLTTYSRFTNITLHDIDKAQRSLKDELAYVRMYLELEKMRYGDKLSYEIDVNENTDQNIMIPNMILHTYAENAIKHGIRSKNAAGHISIKITNEEKGIRLSVEDDGVGREVSAQKNIEQNRTGQGLTILSRQIELYNQQNSQKIRQNIVDIKDENGNAAGTRFELYVPYNYKYI